MLIAILCIVGGLFSAVHIQWILTPIYASCDYSIEGSPEIKNHYAVLNVTIIGQPRDDIRISLRKGKLIPNTTWRNIKEILDRERIDKEDFTGTTASCKLKMTHSPRQTPEGAYYVVELKAKYQDMWYKTYWMKCSKVFEFEGAKLEVRDVQMEMERIDERSFALHNMNYTIVNSGDLPAYLGYLVLATAPANKSIMVPTLKTELVPWSKPVDKMIPPAAKLILKEEWWWWLVDGDYYAEVYICNDLRTFEKASTTGRYWFGMRNGKKYWYELLPLTSTPQVRKEWW